MSTGGTLDYENVIDADSEVQEASGYISGSMRKKSKKICVEAY